MRKGLGLRSGPAAGRIALCLFFLILLALFAADFSVHRHAYFPFEEISGFYPVYGFLSCVVLVFLARLLQFFLMRGEDYYGKK